MYKRILVPLDGSRRAEQILAHVEELALHFEAKVILPDEPCADQRIVHQIIISDNKLKAL